MHPLRQLDCGVALVPSFAKVSVLLTHAKNSNDEDCSFFSLTIMFLPLADSVAKISRLSGSNTLRFLNCACLSNVSLNCCFKD